MTEINNETKVRRSTRSEILETVRVVSYEDLKKARAERAAKEVAKEAKKTAKETKKIANTTPKVEEITTGKKNSNRKRKNSILGANRLKQKTKLTRINII